MQRSPHDPSPLTRLRRELDALRRAASGCLLLVFLLVSLTPSKAGATPEYPLVIDMTLGVNCPRPLSRCLICHTTARGGQRTAEQLFALTMRQFGLVRGREGAVLQSGLQMLPEETDSDGDGAFDKEELRVCGNPSGEELGFGPEYGCDGAHLAEAAPDDVPLMLVAIAIALVLVRRRAPGAEAARAD